MGRLGTLSTEYYIGYAVKIRIKTTKTVMLIKVKESVFKMHIEVRELGKMKTFVWPT